MMAIIIPRLITISILISYLKEWIFFVLFFMVATNCLCNYRFLLRDPAKAFLGCLTNIFAPAIVVEEGSTFLFKSTLYSNLMHGASLITFTYIMACQGFESSSMLLPCGKSQPSIFHCFNNDITFNEFTVKRCPVKG